MTVQSEESKINSYYERETENFNQITYDLKVDQSGNALSIFVTYSFETVMLAMTLKDANTNNIIAVEKLASLEEITNDQKDLSMENDFISFIEVPKIDAGTYRLEILVMKGLFLPTQKFNTCI